MKHVKFCVEQNQLHQPIDSANRLRLDYLQPKPNVNYGYVTPRYQGLHAEQILLRQAREKPKPRRMDICRLAGFSEVFRDQGNSQDQWKDRRLSVPSVV